MACVGALRTYGAPAPLTLGVGHQLHSQMELEEQLDRVADQRSFLVFARALAQDRAAATQVADTSSALPYGPDSAGWESASIESFLEAAVAWAEDSGFGANQGLAGASMWKQFAAFLYAGKIYE